MKLSLLQVFKKENEEEFKEYDAYKEDIAVVNFYYNSPTCQEFVRNPTMTITDFMSQVGGFLGLCVGFSLVSALEIIYWFTVKLFRE